MKLIILKNDVLVSPSMQANISVCFHGDTDTRNCGAGLPFSGFIRALLVQILGRGDSPPKDLNLHKTHKHNR